MGSHSITCHPTEVILTPLPKRIAGTHLLTPEGWKAELTLVAGQTKMIYPQTVTRPSINRARRRVTTLIETNALPTKPELLGLKITQPISPGVFTNCTYLLACQLDSTAVYQWSPWTSCLYLWISHWHERCQHYRQVVYIVQQCSMAGYLYYQLLFTEYW